MICKKCGTENSETSRFCQKCGKLLQPRPHGKAWLIAGSILIGAAIITAALLLLFLPAKTELTGAWHNEELNQLLRFHDDGTVVVRTSAGDYEADFLLDKGGDRGIITLNGTAISFSLSDDSLLLTSNGLETYFSRGEMNVVQATATPTATVPDVSIQNDTATAAPTITPTPVATVTPEPDEEEPVTEDPGIPPYIQPDVFVTPAVDILDALIHSGVVGTWVNTENSSYTLEFESDGSFSATVLRRTFTGTYTFDSATGAGDMTYSDGSVLHFEMSDDTLTREDGKVFSRDE